MDTTDLAQDREDYGALVNTVMDLREILGNTSVAERLTASQEGLGSMELVSQLERQKKMNSSSAVSKWRWCPAFRRLPRYPLSGVVVMSSVSTVYY
jgi:hypothetical protein